MIRKLLPIIGVLLFIGFLIVCIFIIDDKVNPPDDHAEIDIMNTVCVEGILNFSIIDGYDCKYVPIKIKGEYVRCENGD